MFEFFYGTENEKFLFYQIPVLLVKEKQFSKLSTDAKLLYGILLAKTRLSSRNGWLDEKGRVYVYYTVKEAMEDMGCANQKATKIFQELETIGLIKRKRQMNKPAIIYVKNFDSGSRNHENHESKNHENHDSGDVKIMSPESWKSGTNNIDINNIDINNNPSIYLEREDKKMDGWMDKISDIKCQIDYETLKDSYNIPEETLDFCVDIISEVYDKGNAISLVKIKKLNMLDILYVFDCLKTSKPNVKNLRAYLKTSLINAHDSNKLYYDIQFRNNLERN